MNPYPFLVVGLITSALAGALTMVGERSQRALGRGASPIGLGIGALLGGGLIAALDFLVALVVVALWNAIRPLADLELATLTAFIVVAVAHVWSTTALAQRRWRSEPELIDSHGRNGG